MEPPGGFHNKSVHTWKWQNLGYSFSRLSVMYHTLRDKKYQILDHCLLAWCKIYKIITFDFYLCQAQIPRSSEKLLRSQEGECWFCHIYNRLLFKNVQDAGIINLYLLVQLQFQMWVLVEELLHDRGLWDILCFDHVFTFAVGTEFSSVGLLIICWCLQTTCKVSFRFFLLFFMN